MAAPAARFELLRAIERHRARQWIFGSAALLLLGLLSLASAGLGVDSLTPSQVLRAVWSGWLPPAWSLDLTPTQIAIVQDLRLPRTAMAVVCGAGLSMAGVAMQGITRNPLVSPYTLGISPAAGLGASIAILLGLNALPGSGPYWTVALAFASAALCAAVVLGLASLRGVNSLVLILGGVGLTYLFGALTATVQFVASEQQLASIIHWTFGSLNGRTWDEVLIAGAVWLACTPLLCLHAGALNAFAAGGDDVAASLGFAVARTRIVVTLAAVLSSAAIVSFTGVIGFVGLLAPHIARLAIGGDHRVLLPFAAIVGALLVLAADLIGRLAFAPVIVPVGIVVAYIGVPLFLHLLLTRRNEMSS
ncbi:MAG: iron ABC transporter permease [Methylibium sp.]|nr:iron ABC transporter permease [Methylibium sp.]MBA3591800.1 iron ABC transporter permease [Methylibium sp.]